MRAKHDAGHWRAAGPAFFFAALLSVNGGWAAQSPSSAKFDAYLAQGYRSVGTLAATGGDKQLMLKFRRRAALAARGGHVAPLTLAEADVTSWTNREAGIARQQLVSRLDAGARDRQPLLAAIAQVNFDCWISPLPKRIGSTDGDECRRRFYFALAGLRPHDVTIRQGSIAIDPLARPTAPPVEHVGVAKGCPELVVNGLCVKIALIGPTVDLLIRVLDGNTGREDIQTGLASSAPTPSAPAPGGLPGDPPAADPASGTAADPSAARANGGDSGNDGTGGNGAPGAGASGTGNGAAGGVAGGLGNATGAAGGAAGGAASGTGGAVSSTGDAVGAAVGSAGSATGEAVGSATNAAGGAVSSAGSAVGSATSDATGAVGDAVSGAGTTVGGAIGAVGGAVHGATGSLGSATGHSGGLGL
jgi:hypothetical protein